MIWEQITQVKCKYNFLNVIILHRSRQNICHQLYHIFTLHTVLATACKPLRAGEKERQTVEGTHSTQHPVFKFSPKPRELIPSDMFSLNTKILTNSNHDSQRVLSRAGERIQRIKALGLACGQLQIQSGHWSASTVRSEPWVHKPAGALKHCLVQKPQNKTAFQCTNIPHARPFQYTALAWWSPTPKNFMGKLIF